LRFQQILPRAARDLPRGAAPGSTRRLAQAAFIREASPGFFTALPLLQAALVRLEQLLREALAAPGGQEWAWPAVLPLPPAGSGGEPALRCAFSDRSGATLAAAPPDDSLVLRLLAQDLNSYKQLPQLLYGFRRAWRHEHQAKAGLAAAREYPALRAWALADAVERLPLGHPAGELLGRVLCDRLNLPVTWIEGEPGPDGAGPGRILLVPLPEGPAATLQCPVCGYAAAAEWATGRLPQFPQDAGPAERAAVHGPGLIQVEPLARHIGIPVWKTTKMLLFLADGRPVAVMLRGDSHAAENKLVRFLGCRRLELAPPDLVRELTGAEVGYAGPLGLPPAVRVIADVETRDRVNFECGANRTDYHLVNVNFGRDLPWPDFDDFKRAAAGQACSRCGEGTLEAGAGLPVGRLDFWAPGQVAGSGCAYLDRDGSSRSPWLGVLGLDLFGVTAALAEVHHDERGLLWPPAVAPGLVHLVGLNLEDENVAREAASLYLELERNGLPTLFDDRDLKAGDKFAEAELIGLPAQLTISRRTCQAGQLELKFRRRPERELLTPDQAIARIKMDLAGYTLLC